MYIKILFTLLCCGVAFVLATDVCINKSPCKCVLDSSGNAIDLSSVGLLDFPRFYMIQSNDSSIDPNLYSYNPCYGFDLTDSHVVVKEGNAPCRQAAACVQTPGGNKGELPERHALGLQSDGKFGSVANLGYHINYTVSGSKQELIVQLICDENVTDHTLLVEPPSSNIIKMTLTSKCACKNGCVTSNPPLADEGLSTGSALLITFFTIALAYFLIGIIWNFFNGAQGPELVPNLQFWNELPKLIIEGVIFTCSCFGRKSSYGEV